MFGCSAFIPLRGEADGLLDALAAANDRNRDRLSLTFAKKRTEGVSVRDGNTIYGRDDIANQEVCIECGRPVDHETDYCAPVRLEFLPF